MKIVVIGGAGLIGSKTIPILRQHAHEVVAASPNTGANTITGEGLKEAMAGMQVVIDLAGDHERLLSSPAPPAMTRTPVSRWAFVDPCTRRGEHSEWTCRQRESHHESRSTP